MKITTEDQLWSRLIRKRDNFTCQRCGKKYEEGQQGLHCHHHRTRSCNSTRFDWDNCASLCHGCHQYVHSHALEHVEFFKSRLGAKRYNALIKRSNTPLKITKEDRKQMRKDFKELLAGR